MASTDLGARDVRDVEPRPGELREHQVAHHEHVFRQGRVAGQAEPGGDGPLVDDTVAHQGTILGVDDDGDVDETRVLEDVTHHAAVLDRPPVVAEGHGAGGDQGGHLRHDLPFEARVAAAIG